MVAIHLRKVFVCSIKIVELITELEVKREMKPNLKIISHTTF